jgi:hypothetical protein
MSGSTERVRRYRAKQTKRGLIHIELYVAPELLVSVKQYGDAWETSVPESLVSLVFTGLRAEGYLESQIGDL